VIGPRVPAASARCTSPGSSRIASSASSWRRVVGILVPTRGAGAAAARRV
jgi:hypothetical protein